MPLVKENRVIRRFSEVLTKDFIGCYNNVILEKVGDKSMSESSVISDEGYAVG